MPQSPGRARTVPDPRKPLIDLVASLNACARAIDDFIGKQRNPYSQICQQLRTKEQAIVDSANDISDVAMENITADISKAIGELQTQINSAKDTLASIKVASQVIAITSAVLAAAAGVATGGFLAGAPAILTFAQRVVEIVSTAKKKSDD
jgi:hypothetical protein